MTTVTRDSMELRNAFALASGTPFWTDEERKPCRPTWPENWSRSEPQARSTSDCSRWRAAVALPPATVRWAADNGWGTSLWWKRSMAAGLMELTMTGWARTLGFAVAIGDGRKRCINRVPRLAGAGGRQGCFSARQCHEPLAEWRSGRLVHRSRHRPHGGWIRDASCGDSVLGRSLRAMDRFAPSARALAVAAARPGDVGRRCCRRLRGDSQTFHARVGVRADQTIHGGCLWCDGGRPSSGCPDDATRPACLFLKDRNGCRLCEDVVP